MNPQFKLAKDLTVGDIIFDLDTEMPKEILSIEYPNPEIVTVSVEGDYGDTWSYDFDINDEIEIVLPSEYKTNGYDERTYDPFEGADLVTESGAVVALWAVLKRCAMIAIKELTKNATVDVNKTGDGKFTADVVYKGKEYSFDIDPATMSGKSKDFIVSQFKKLFNREVKEAVEIEDKSRTLSYELAVEYFEKNSGLSLDVAGDAFAEVIIDDFESLENDEGEFYISDLDRFVLQAKAEYSDWKLEQNEESEFAITTSMETGEI